MADVASRGQRRRLSGRLAGSRRPSPAARPIGSIEPGRAADLVLVESNPLEDVSAMRQVAGVVVRGRWFPIEELDRMRSSGR